MRTNIAKQLRSAGFRWRHTAAGTVRIYIHTGCPQRMRDGSYWNGTETVGEYDSLDAALNCGTVAQTIAERA